MTSLPHYITRELIRISVDFQYSPPNQDNIASLGHVLNKDNCFLRHYEHFHLRLLICSYLRNKSDYTDAAVNEAAAVNEVH